MAGRITLIATLAVALMTPAAASAATIDVDTTSDSAAAGGCTSAPNDCSLRQAVNAASQVAGTGDTIDLPAGDYSLSLGEIDINSMGNASDLTISGAGARTTTVDAAGSSRIFDARGDEVTISGVTLTGGSAPAVGSPTADFAGDGGAILARAALLTLERVAITDSRAQLNGGAVAVPPENGNITQGIVVDESTIAGNKVTGGAAEGLGGGIYVLGDLTMTNSTVTGNAVENAVGTSQGGGIMAAVQPAQTTNTEIKIVNSTIAKNSVPDLTGMGGGIASYIAPSTMATSGLDITNTIVADNTAGTTASDCMLATIPTSDHNLSGDASCQFAGAGNLPGTNPQLGPLSDNGGPTDTMALPAASPAIDAGTDTGCPATDQRGTTRPQGTNCDIGAYERVPDPTPPPSPPPPDAATADLGVSLRAKPRRPKPRHKITYRLTVTNAGPGGATDSVLTGAVSKKVKRLRPGAPCKLGAGRKGKRTFTCELGDLAAGATTTIKLRAKVARKARAAKARVGVTTTAADTNGGNDAAKLKSKVRKPKRK